MIKLHYRQHLFQFCCWHIRWPLAILQTSPIPPKAVVPSKPNQSTTWHSATSSNGSIKKWLCYPWVWWYIFCFCCNTLLAIRKFLLCDFFHLDTPVGRIVFPSFGYCWMPQHLVPSSSRVPCIPTNSLKCMCVTAYLWVVTEDNTICNNWCSALHSGDLSAKKSPQSPCRYLTFSLTEVYNTSTDTARIYSMIRLWLNLIACVPDLSA